LDQLRREAESAFCGDLSGLSDRIGNCLPR
jgi:hypothetical protein